MGTNDRKLCPISHISLCDAMTFGFEEMRGPIWEQILKEAEIIVADELPLSAKGVRKGLREVRGLRDAFTAAKAGDVHKKLFKHLFHTRLRVYIACAIEDSIPGKWTCVWSNTRVREVCYELHSILETVLLSRSRLLQSLPTAAVVGFYECVLEHENCLTSDWWRERDNHKKFMRRALNYALEVLEVSSPPKEFLAAIKRSSTLFRLAFLHLSAVTSDFSAQGFASTPERIQQMIDAVTKGGSQNNDDHINPVYFTEVEIQEVIKCVAGLAPDFENELSYIFNLQKVALQNASSDAIGRYCYVSNEKDVGSKKASAPLSLYAMDAFLLDASIMLADLNAVPLKLMKIPHLSWSQQILFELGQPRVERIYQMSFVKLFAVVEVFGTGGVRVEAVQCESLAREIGEKLTSRGRFSTKRTRVLLTDPRLRRRTPQMLRIRRPQNSIDDSESDVSESESEQEDCRECEEEDHELEYGTAEVIDEEEGDDKEPATKRRKTASKGNVDNNSNREKTNNADRSSGTGIHGSANRSGNANRSASASRGGSAGRGGSADRGGSAGRGGSTGRGGSADRNGSASAPTATTVEQNDDNKRSFHRFRRTTKRARSGSRSRDTAEDAEKKVGGAAVDESTGDTDETVDNTSQQ